MTDKPKFSPVVEKFILHWGEMGTKWGINRTVAQVHALLYISERPLNAEEIAESLGVARSNVSTSLRELQSWRIVKLVHLRGDKRDYFESMKDVWEMFRVIVEERKRREVDPTIQVLRECIQESDKKENAYAVERLKALQEFFEAFSKSYHQLSSVSTQNLVRLTKLGDKVLKFLG